MRFEDYEAGFIVFLGTDDPILYKQVVTGKGVEKWKQAASKKLKNIQDNKQYVDYCRATKEYFCQWYHEKWDKEE